MSPLDQMTKPTEYTSVVLLIATWALRIYLFWGWFPAQYQTFCTSLPVISRLVCWLEVRDAITHKSCSQRIQASFRLIFNDSLLFSLLKRVHNQYRNKETDVCWNSHKEHNNLQIQLSSVSQGDYFLNFPFFIPSQFQETCAPVLLVLLEPRFVRNVFLAWNCISCSIYNPFVFYTTSSIVSESKLHIYVVQSHCLMVKYTPQWV